MWYTRGVSTLRRDVISTLRRDVMSTLRRGVTLNGGSDILTVRGAFETDDELNAAAAAAAAAAAE